MPAIITDTFDYDDIVRVLDLDEAFARLLWLAAIGASTI